MVNPKLIIGIFALIVLGGILLASGFMGGPTFGSQAQLLQNAPSTPTYNVYVDGYVKFESAPFVGSGWSLVNVISSWSAQPRMVFGMMGLISTEEVTIQCTLRAGTETSSIYKVSLGSFQGLGASTLKQFTCVFPKVLSGQYAYRINVLEAGMTRATLDGSVMVG